MGGKTDVEQLKGILQQFSREDLLKALSELGLTVETDAEVPFEEIKMSELPDEREERTRVIIMDKKLKRKVRPGEEERLDEIAAKEGVSEYGEDVPGGSTVISGPTISARELSAAITRDFGKCCKGGAIFMSDSYYFLYPDAEIEKVLSEDLTDLQMWINTYFDCDDFAQVVAGVVNQQLKGAPFGVLWFKCPNMYHAVNCFYSMNQRKMKVVEPQTDRIYDFDKRRCCPMLVVI